MNLPGCQQPFKLSAVLASLEWPWPTLPLWAAAPLHSQLISQVSWPAAPDSAWRLKLRGDECFPLQLQSFGMVCRCTLDRLPLCLILKVSLKPTSFLWLSTPHRVLILCVFMWLYLFYVYTCIFFSLFYPFVQHFVETLCLFKLVLYK